MNALLSTALCASIIAPLAAQDGKKPDSAQQTLDGRDADRKPQFSAYWRQGKAELSRFELSESRYGQARKGDAVLVFVTEGFLPKKQVKHEIGDPRRRGAVSILKLNTVKKFKTGVYDYSLMTSVFAPTDGRQAFKLTATVQEWCGHVFTQLNLRDDKYRVRGFSYFEAEGDEDFKLGAAMLENEIWTRIRLAPKTLPQGDVKLIPSVFDARLRHRRLAVQPATATLRSLEVGGKVAWRYSIAYPRLQRTLSIDFEKAFPYRILGWTENLGYGRITTAKRSHVKMLDYWNRNDNRDETLRKGLGLK